MLLTDKSNCHNTFDELQSLMSDSNGTPLDQRLLGTRTRRSTPVLRRSAQLPSQPALFDAAHSITEVKAEELTNLRALNPLALYQPEITPQVLIRDSRQERLSVRSYTSESVSQEKGLSHSPHPERLSLYFENVSAVQQPRRNQLQINSYTQLLPAVIERLKVYLQPTSIPETGELCDPFDRPPARQSLNDDFSAQIASSCLSNKHVTKIKSLRPTFPLSDLKRRRRKAKQKRSVRPFKVRKVTNLPIFNSPGLPTLSPVGHQFGRRISDLSDMHLSEDGHRLQAKFTGRLERRKPGGGFTKRVPPMTTLKLQHDGFSYRRQGDN